VPCPLVLQALLRETGKFPSADLQRTSEASLTALLDSCGFYHPVSTAWLAVAAAGGAELTPGTATHRACACAGSGYWSSATVTEH
jgi:hypothetical protein